MYIAIIMTGDYHRVAEFHGCYPSLYQAAKVVENYSGERRIEKRIDGECVQTIVVE